MLQGEILAFSCTFVSLKGHIFASIEKFGSHVWKFVNELLVAYTDLFVSLVYTECKYGGPLSHRPGRVANMADHAVIARDELHESEASVLLRGRSSLFYFAMPTSFCVHECHQKGWKLSNVRVYGKIVDPWNSLRRRKWVDDRRELKFVRYT